MADPSPIPPPPDYFVEELADDCRDDDDDDDDVPLELDDPHHLVPLRCRQLEAQGTLSDPGNGSIRSLSIDQEDVTFDEQVCA